MFVYTFKASRRQIVSMIFCVLVLIAVLVVAILWPLGGGTSAETFKPAAAGSDNERIAFLSNLGYEVEVSSATVKEVLIPDEFDDVFAGYNQIQKQADMDLEPYQGKRVKCWSYRVLNIQSDGDVFAHLYVYKDKVIGGDIASTELNGFMRGLTKYQAGEQAGDTVSAGTETSTGKEADAAASNAAQ